MIGLGMELTIYHYLENIENIKANYLEDLGTQEASKLDELALTILRVCVLCCNFEVNRLKPLSYEYTLLPPPRRQGQ